MEPSLRGRVRDGDPDAFGVLFDDHSRVVYNLAFRLTGSWVEAEEVVSLTFLEAWRLRARVEPDGESLRPWLMGITVNVVRNFSRATRRHKAAMARLPEPTAVPDFALRSPCRPGTSRRKVLQKVREVIGVSRLTNREPAANGGR